MDLLLIIRGLAAISVVVWHSQGYLGEFPSVLNIPGRTAVWLFFGISGYVISYGFIHNRYYLTLPDLKDFYTNRFLRVYPLFFAVSLLSLVVGFIGTGNSPISLNEIPSQFLAYQFNHEYKLNGVFWTLGIEMQFYVIAPILVLPLLIHNNHYALFFAFILYILMIQGYRYGMNYHNWSIDGRNIFSNLSHFFIGMMACRIVVTFKPNRLVFYASLITACILLGYTNWLYHDHAERYWSLNGVVLVDFIILLFVLSHASANVNRVRRSWRAYFYKMLAFLGIISYGIYVLHGYILKYYPITSKYVIILIIISILMAYITYRYIETPFLRLKRKH